MQYRTLGRTSLKVSVVGLGTMVHAGHFGPMSDSDSLAAINTALDLGVNFIDTSDAYGGGSSETLLGKALKGKRDKVVLATKGGNIMVGPNRGNKNFSVSYISRVLDGSLKRLQTDFVDLYQLHNPTIDVIEQGEIWELLDRRKREGKIRFYGVSINRMEEGISAVIGGRSDSIQIEFNIMNQEPSREVLPLAQKSNIAVIARVPLRRGLLSGKMTLADLNRFKDGDIRERQFNESVLSNELSKVESLRFLEKGGRRSLAQSAIAYCIANSAVSVVIPGARNAKQMRENAAAADIHFSSEELQKLSDLWKNEFSAKQ